MPTPPTTQLDPIKIFYPNGGNEAVQVYVWDGAKPVLWDGQVTFSGTISIGTVSGTLTNDNAPPASDNFGVLPAVVSTVGLNYTSGNQVLLRTDTTGALVITGSISVSTTGLALASNQTDGSQKTQVVNTTNNTQAFGAGTTTTTTVRVVLPTDQTAVPISGAVTATISNTTMTVVQATGTNLHAVIDSGNVNSTVSGTVTATISNTTMTVVQATGTNLHAVIDSGNVNSTVTGTVTATISNATLSVISTTLATNAGAPNLATGQVTVSTTATVIAASRATRRSLTVINGGGTDVYFGGTTVSTTTGALLFGTTGAAVSIFYTGTVSGIVAASTRSVSFFEEYD